MRLVLASEEQKKQRDALTYSAWGASLDLEQYRHREEILRRHAWSRGGMSTWLLCAPDGQVLSSCETYRMESVAKDGAGAIQGSTYGVASVFTEACLRGKGYATALIDRVMRALVETDSRLQASILFSDVGARIYERCGFVARPAFDWKFPALKESENIRGELPVDERRLTELVLSAPRPGARFFVWPTADQIDWYLERERTYARMLGRARPKQCGAQIGTGFAVWAARYQTDELLVLVLHAAREDEAGALLGAAQRAAGQAGLSGVGWWEQTFPFALDPLVRRGTRIERQGSLPMLRTFDARVRAEDWTWIPRATWM